MSIDLQSYRAINESYSKKLAFHLGSRSGFFSEHLGMLRAMVYCLQNEIQFQLYSKDTNFATRAGWTDFFEPFCVEQSSPLHLVFNPRFPTPKFRFKLRKAAAPAVKWLCGVDFLSYDLWSAMHVNHFNSAPLAIPALGLEGPAEEVFRQINDIIWRFTGPTGDEIAATQQALKLPERYAAIHIRAGDKHKESEVFSPAAFMEQLNELTELRDVVVLTDDYANYEQLVQDYPEMRFYTLEQPEQRGYDHRVNKRRSAAQKHLDYVQFLAGMETAAKADLYLGTYSSNVSSFLRLRMAPERCLGIDVLREGAN